MSTELATSSPSNSPSLLRPIASPQQAMKVHEEVVAFITTTLEEKRDYGNIPGTTKPTLLKPGAERLCAGFGLRAEYETLDSEVDHNYLVTSRQTKWTSIAEPNRETKEQLKKDFPGRFRNKKFSEGGRDVWYWQEAITEEVESQGLYRYVVKCRLFTYDGREVGQGVGSCSTLESKYIRAPRDAENTVLKMAMKRAHVSAVLTTLGLSDRFTMDMEDLQENKQSRTAPSPEDIQDAEFTEDQAAQAGQSGQATQSQAPKPNAPSGQGQGSEGGRRPLPSRGPNLNGLQPLVHGWQSQKPLPAQSNSAWTTEKSGAQYGKLRSELERVCSDASLHKFILCEVCGQIKIAGDYKESKAFVSFVIDLLTTADSVVIENVVAGARKRKEFSARPSDGTSGS